MALSEIGHPAAVSRLRAALLVVDDEELERRILRRLGATRGPARVAALAALLEHLAHSVRTRAETVRAIAALGDRKAVRPLIEALDEERYVTARVELVRALGQLGDRKAVAPLVALLHDEAEPVVLEETTVALTVLSAVRAAGGVDLSRMRGWSCAQSGEALAARGCAPPPAGARLPLAGSTLWLVTADGASGALEAGRRLDLVAERHSYQLPMPSERSIRTLVGAPRLRAAFSR